MDLDLDFDFGVGNIGSGNSDDDDDDLPLHDACDEGGDEASVLLKVVGCHALPVFAWKEIIYFFIKKSAKGILQYY